jgi:DNA helicase-2/ATP-dependent DNA helicase PcrA
MRRITPEFWVPRGVPSLEPAALEVVRTTQNALVVAGPGAGKTELLAQRASFLLETGNCATPYRVLAISFKRDAARNLRERVALRCGPELARRLESYTFDAWAKGLLDRFRPSLPPEYRPTSDYVLDFKLSDESRLQSSFLAISAIAGVDPQINYQLETVAVYRKYLANVVIDLQSPTVRGKV